MAGSVVMRILEAIGLMALALLVGSSVAGAEDAKTSDGKIVGSWKIVSVEANGEKKTGGDVTMGAVKFDDKKLYLGEGEFSFVMNYKLDKSASPHPVTLSIASSPFGADPTPHAGLISVEGDTMKLIYAMPGEAAPKAFKAPAGGRYRNMVLNRVK